MVLFVNGHCFYIWCQFKKTVFNANWIRRRMWFKSKSSDTNWLEGYFCLLLNPPSLGRDLWYEKSASHDQCCPTKLSSKLRRSHFLQVIGSCLSPSVNPNIFCKVSVFYQSKSFECDQCTVKPDLTTTSE